MRYRASTLIGRSGTGFRAGRQELLQELVVNIARRSSHEKRREGLRRDREERADVAEDASLRHRNGPAEQGKERDAGVQ